MPSVKSLVLALLVSGGLAVPLHVVKRLDSQDDALSSAISSLQSRAEEIDEEAPGLQARQVNPNQPAAPAAAPPATTDDGEWEYYEVEARDLSAENLGEGEGNVLSARANNKGNSKPSSKIPPSKTDLGKQKVREKGELNDIRKDQKTQKQNANFNEQKERKEIADARARQMGANTPSAKEAARLDKNKEINELNDVKKKNQADKAALQRQKDKENKELAEIKKKEKQQSGRTGRVVETPATTNYKPKTPSSNNGKPYDPYVVGYKDPDYYYNRKRNGRFVDTPDSHITNPDVYYNQRSKSDRSTKSDQIIKDQQKNRDREDDRIRKAEYDRQRTEGKLKDQEYARQREEERIRKAQYNKQNSDSSKQRAKDDDRIRKAEYERQRTEAKLKEQEYARQKEEARIKDGQYDKKKTDELIKEQERQRERERNGYGYNHKRAVQQESKVGMM
ncbi:hypothetical protein CKAH01_08332 [Colletotrichum kahawae]|uniref:Uncharacterized protein n=1 Tax=Colletotrichum kahawae TaxID=34407 RepID=A0AAD9Y1A9_COLKA|nr:hypothetical protein CKAH01_08332 [Colletotrichum kahawae]